MGQPVEREPEVVNLVSEIEQPDQLKAADQLQVA